MKVFVKSGTKIIYIYHANDDFSYIDVSVTMMVLNASCNGKYMDGVWVVATFIYTPPKGK